MLYLTTVLTAENTIDCKLLCSRTLSHPTVPTKLGHGSVLSSVVYNSNVLFTPIAMEMLGVAGPAASDFIKELGRRQCDALGDPRATSQLWQRISLQLQRRNARCVFETFSD